MSAGLASFAQGFAGSLNQHNRRKEQKERDARFDKLMEYGALPGPAQGMPGASEAGSGYGVRGSSGGGASGDGSLIGLIDRYEGGGDYNTLFGYSNRGGKFDGVNVSEMTLAQLADFSNPSGEYGQWVKGHVGRVATPMGRHQIVGRTLRGASKEMGLSPDTKFTPQTQDAIASHLAQRRLSSAKSPAAKRAALRAEWEGFKNVGDDELDAAIAHFEANGMEFRPRPMGAGPT